jgi:hypothetical protein
LCDRDLAVPSYDRMWSRLWDQKTSPEAGEADGLVTTDSTKPTEDLTGCLGFSHDSKDLGEIPSYYWIVVGALGINMAWWVFSTSPPEMVDPCSQ